MLSDVRLHGAAGWMDAYLQLLFLIYSSDGRLAAAAHALSVSLSLSLYLSLSSLAWLEFPRCPSVVEILLHRLARLVGLPSVRPSL